MTHFTLFFFFFNNSIVTGRITTFGSIYFLSLFYIGKGIPVLFPRSKTRGIHSLEVLILLFPV